MKEETVRSLSERELWTLKEFVENTLRKSGALLMGMYGRGNNKLKFDASRNDHWNVTFHDSCNPARAMGLLEEPSGGKLDAVIYSRT